MASINAALIKANEDKDALIADKDTLKQELKLVQKQMSNIKDTCEDRVARLQEEN